MNDTPRTDAFTSAKYNNSMAAASDLPGFGGTDESPEDAYKDAVEFARQLERDLIAACEERDDMKRTADNLIHNFDVAIRKIATELTGQACGGVDTGDNVNPETGKPYGPGGHTGWLLASEAKKLREERDKYKADSEWLLRNFRHMINGAIKLAQLDGHPAYSDCPEHLRKRLEGNK